MHEKLAAWAAVGLPCSANKKSSVANGAEAHSFQAQGTLSLKRNLTTQAQQVSHKADSRCAEELNMLYKLSSVLEVTLRMNTCSNASK